MKLNSRSALMLLLGLFGLLACKGKEQAPMPSASGAALAAGSALPTANAGAALNVLDGFEGEIALTAKGKLTGKEGSVAPANFTLLVKDGKFRFDVPEGLRARKRWAKRMCWSSRPTKSCTR